MHFSTRYIQECDGDLIFQYRAPENKIRTLLNVFRKKKTQVRRHRDLNQGPPECEFRVLQRSHLAQLVISLFFFYYYSLLFRDASTSWSYRF